MKTNFSESNVSENSSNFEFLESASDSEVDGSHILARVRGPAFFPETTSRNNVFYSLEAWENAISHADFRRRLGDRLVFGTIGHNAELTDDDIREGRLSHIVSNAWIGEDNIGYAEYLILNTPPGRILNTLLRAKSKLRVSTKASGFFENGKAGSGTKHVIPSSFELERIDFVIDPGYLKALPELLESLQDKSFINEFLTEGNNMEKVVSILEARIQDLTAEKSITESTAKELQTEVRRISEALAVNNVTLNNYKELGSVASIQESMSELAQYQSIGSVQEIHEAMEEGEEVIQDMTQTISDLQSELEEAPSEYAELGEPSEIKQALDQALTVVDELEQYKELGTVEEINQLIDNANAMAEAQEQEAAASLASTYDVPLETVTGLLGKGLTLEEVDGVLGQIKPKAEESPSDAPVVTEDDDEDEEVPADGEGAPTDTPADAPAEEPEVEDEDDEEISESRSSAALRRMRGEKLPVPIKESRNPSTSRVARLMAVKK